MPRWVVVFLLAVIMALPARATAADCATPGVPGQFDVFARSALNSANTTIPGRVAAGGNAVLTGPNSVKLKSGREISAKYILVATGGHPHLHDISG